MIFPGIRCTIGWPGQTGAGTRRDERSGDGPVGRDGPGSSGALFAFGTPTPKTVPGSPCAGDPPGRRDSPGLTPDLGNPESIRIDQGRMVH
jgi:hypothetical protein